MKIIQPSITVHTKFEEIPVCVGKLPQGVEGFSQSALERESTPKKLLEIL